MPIRIYALAKDLKIDSKDLVDLCTKAGITGKGSALASLEDDEVTKLKSYLDGASKRSAPAPAAPLVDMKAVLASPVGSTATLPPPPPPPPKTPPKRSAPVVEEPTPAVAEEAAPTPPPEPAAEPTPPPVVVAETPVPVEPKVEEAPAAPAVKVPPPAPTVRVAPAAPKTTPPRKEQAPPAAPAASNPSATTTPPPGNAPSTPPPSSSPSAPQRRQPGPLAPRPADMAPVRGDSLSPGRRPGIIKVLDAGKRNVETKGKEGGAPGAPAGDPPRDPQRGQARRPVIRLGEMPKSNQPPPPPPKSNEPAPQKPIMRLPTDAIAGGKRGVKPPLGELTASMNRDRRGPGDVAGKKPAMRGPLPIEPDLTTPGKGGALARGKKGVKGAPGTDAGLADMASVRADRNKARGPQQAGRRSNHFSHDDDGGRRRKNTLTRLKSHQRTAAAPRKDKLEVEVPCTVRTFSEQAGIGAGKVVAKLMVLGIMARINDPIPNEYVELLIGELGLDVTVKQPLTLEEELTKEFEGTEDAPESLVARPPIVTFLGHVDHGKTSLLDRIIGTNVVSGEAGGITQHIRAYTIKTKDGRVVAFVDTPGHEAFTEMRARGANVTDIAVLVVAADDGVMPQTEEAISHAKAAGVPIVVAMNKCDLPGADQQRVLQQLATAGLLPSEWGGEVEVVRTSAITGEGMDTLLETLLVTAELHEYKANPTREASGMCLESEQEAGRGVIAKLMVQNGTLREGDIVVCGSAHGRVKAMYDTLRPRVRLKEAPPSTPINVTGLDVAPGAGEKFYVLDDIGRARELAVGRADKSRHQSLSGTTTKVSFEEFQKQLSEGRVGKTEEATYLNLIIRADVRGSIEAILKELSKFDHPEVKIKVLQASVGGVSVADVTLAHASNAVIIAFNVIPDEAARALSDDRHVEIRRYDIIYKVTDDIKALLEGKLKPEERVVDMGRALVKQAFVISRVGTVAGSQVIQGTIDRSCRVRVNRENRTIGDYAIDSLRRDKDDVKEVSRGMECGIKLANFNDIKEGDLLEAYKIEEVARTL